jgi:hypothetical protein
MIGAEYPEKVGPGSLEKWSRLSNSSRVAVDGPERAPARDALWIIRAEQPLTCGRSLLRRLDRIGKAATSAVGAGQPNAAQQRVRMVGPERLSQVPKGPFQAPNCRVPLPRPLLSEIRSERAAAVAALSAPRTRSRLATTST